jgi:hypothetical protein
VTWIKPTLASATLYLQESLLLANVLFDYTDPVNKKLYLELMTEIAMQNTMNYALVTTREIGPYIFEFRLGNNRNGETRCVIHLIEAGSIIWQSKPFKNKNKLTRKWIVVAQAFLAAHLQGLKERTLATIFETA